MESEEMFIAIVREIAAEAQMESCLDHLLINSINYMRLLVMLEETFDFEFEEDALSKGYFSHVKDIYEYIDRLS